MGFDSKLQIFSIILFFPEVVFRVSVRKATRYPLGKRPRNGKIHDLAAEAQGDGSSGRVAIGGGFRSKDSSFTGVTRSGNPCHPSRSLARQAASQDAAREKFPAFPRQDREKGGGEASGPPGLSGSTIMQQEKKVAGKPPDRDDRSGT